MLKVHKNPCGSCPYRKDVPSGIWAETEYVKLPAYDEPMAFQPRGVFMCHQRDEHLCAGWLATHGAHNLLAMRLAALPSFFEDVDPAVWDYTTETPCFASGREAAEHGIAGIENPSDEAKRKVAGLEKILRK